MVIDDFSSLASSSGDVSNKSNEISLREIELGESGLTISTMDTS